MKEVMPKMLTARKKEFSDWFNQVLFLAEIIDKRYVVKGTAVWLSYGYEAMLRIKAIWDKIFKENGYKELYFPLLVPLEYAKQNDKWWKGFKEQAFWVRGGEKSEEEWILRPTGEPAMYPMFKLWIRTHNDLPIKIYETVSSFRYETKHTRPIIRDREILVWHEIHTVHATKEEADTEVEIHQKMWDELWKLLGIFPLKVKKPEWECFPGAVGAIEYYNLMPNGKAMENGSVNHLGQAYAKKFNIKFKDVDGKEKYVWQTCTGNGARLLAAVIGIHGDDRGLLLPPSIAPIQVVIVPIIMKGKEKEIVMKCEEVLSKVKNEFRVEFDKREYHPGYKYAEWEIKGVPIRIEIGPQEVKRKEVVVFRRDTLERETIKEEELKSFLRKTLDRIQKSMYEKAKEFLLNGIKEAESTEEMIKIIRHKQIAKVSWCGSGECWDEIKAKEEGIELFGTDLKEEKGKCIVCGKPSKEKGYVAKTY